MEEDVFSRLIALEQRVSELEELQKFDADLAVGMTVNLENDLENLFEEVRDCKALIAKTREKDSSENGPG